MLIKSIIDWFEKPFACPGDTTSEDNSLRIDNRSIVSQAHAKVMTCTAEDFNGHLVTLVTTLCDDTRRQLFQTTQQRGRVRFFHQFTSCLYNTIGTSISLKATFMTTAALTAILNDTGMTKLTSEA